MSQKGFEESQERELFMFQGEVSLKKDVPKVKSVRVELTPADATKPVKVEELNVFACGKGCVFIFIVLYLSCNNIMFCFNICQLYCIDYALIISCICYTCSS